MNQSVLHIRGKVVKGKGRGKGLGFPTANMQLSKHIPEGIYLAKTIWKGKEYPSLFFSGRAKTYEEKYWSHEILLLDIEKDLYGEWLEITILKKLRNNKKFSSPKELAEAIQGDVERARKYFD